HGTMPHAAPTKNLAARCRRPRSIGILGLEQRERRTQHDREIKKDRPVLYVVEIVLDALLYFLVRVRLATPSIDLCPARDTGFHAVAREIAVDGLVVQSGFCLGID